MPKPSVSNHQHLNIAVIGAGLMGRLLAWRLLMQDHSVSLFEKDHFSRSTSAAYTAAAMISPLSEVVASNKAIYEMGIESLALWPKWLEQLNDGARSLIHYDNPGSIVVAHTQDWVELDQFYQDLNFHLGKANSARWLDQPTLRQVEPDLGEQFERALLLPDEAYLDNRALLQCLFEKICEFGGQCFEQSDVTLDCSLNIQGHDSHTYDCVFDCRGVGANTTPGIRGVRGEVLWVETPDVTLRHPIRLMHPRYKLYVVPKPGNQFIVGATEIESEDRSPMSVQSMMELCSALYTLNPAFAEARIKEIDTNLRPATLDNMPIIKPYNLNSGQRVIQINGLYRHGYLLAPYLTLQAEKHIYQ